MVCTMYGWIWTWVQDAEEYQEQCCGNAATDCAQCLFRSWPQVAPTALETSENILMCAPTGAGKTNVAMLAILHTLSLYRDAATGAIDADKFKIIYVAPMKVRRLCWACT